MGSKSRDEAEMEFPPATQQVHRGILPMKALAGSTLLLLLLLAQCAHRYAASCPSILKRNKKK
jgi:hypothetical protein